MLNDCIFIGVLKETPQVKTMSNGLNSCIINLDVGTSWKQKDGTYYQDNLNIVAYGDVADKIAKECKVGMKLDVRAKAHLDNDKLVLILDKYQVLARNLDIEQLKGEKYENN